MAVEGTALLGRGAGCVGRTRERNMAFSGKQAGGWIESNPARAWQENFGPGVQIGEVARRAGGTFKRLNVGCKLDQIARDKARREP